jgi:hypothetical protein
MNIPEIGNAISELGNGYGYTLFTDLFFPLGHRRNGKRNYE